MNLEKNKIRTNKQTKNFLPNRPMFIRLGCRTKAYLQLEMTVQLCQIPNLRHTTVVLLVDLRQLGNLLLNMQQCQWYTTSQGLVLIVYLTTNTLAKTMVVFRSVEIGLYASKRMKNTVKLVMHKLKSLIHKERDCDH